MIVIFYILSSLILTKMICGSPGFRECPCGGANRSCSCSCSGESGLFCGSSISSQEGALLRLRTSFQGSLKQSITKQLIFVSKNFILSCTHIFSCPHIYHAHLLIADIDHFSLLWHIDCMALCRQPCSLPLLRCVSSLLFRRKQDMTAFSGKKAMRL